MKAKLSEKMVTLLLMGVKRRGSYDPDEVLVGDIEESMTGPEIKQAIAFLTWVHAGNLQRHFGHGNIQNRYAEFLAGSVK